MNGREEVVPIGSFITGRKVLSAMLKQSENKIRQNLKILESCSIIERKITNKFTLIKIVNYWSYQTSDNENHQQITNKSPTNHQQITTNKNIRTKEIKNKELKHICESSDSYTPEFEEFYKT